MELFGWTFILFDYEADKKKQDRNRRENKKHNPVNNTDPTKQEDEVGASSTKQGGARGVRKAVPTFENASHGGMLGAAVFWLKMKDGDQFLTILLPDNNNAQAKEVPEPVTVPVPVRLPVTQRSSPQPQPTPVGTPGSTAPQKVGGFALLGAAINAAIISLSFDGTSRDRAPL